MTVDGGIAAKRARQHIATETSANALSSRVLAMLAALPQQDLGLHVAVRLLHFLGDHGVVACSRATLEWFTRGGLRLCPCINDECHGNGPFTLLARIAVRHVESICLGGYGRANIGEYADVIAACKHASILRCVHAKLAGLGPALDQCLLSGGFPCLRRLHFHKCGLSATDAAKLLCLAPQVEQIHFSGEALAGLGTAILEHACPSETFTTVDFTDCGLRVDDVTTFLKFFGESIRSLRIQASNLQGLQVPCLASLKILVFEDCSLSRQDATSAMRKCPSLKVLSFCRNTLGEHAGYNGTNFESENSDDEEEEEEGEPDEAADWPCMTHLREADFRACGLSRKDERDLRRAFPKDVKLHVQTAPPSTGIKTTDRWQVAGGRWQFKGMMRAAPIQADMSSRVRIMTW